ncbi:MAG TPA: NAD(P)/FAD-dependent oxidoreductase, partial [Bacteroidia bacterium]|nr:NAD(P)/FAD-dependent oxidoreductase [Bacteroidia bacterium]
LIEEFKANYRPGAEKLSIIDKKAKILVDEHTQKKDEIARLEIDRGPLQNILLNSLKQDTVVWDSQLVSISAHNDSWKLEFKNGSSVIADIVIGADGANSKIRPYVTPIKSFYTGVTAIEGIVYNSETKSPNMHALLKGGKIFAMGDERSLILSSKGDGSLVFYPSFKAEENWHKECGINFNDKAEVLAWFKKEYTGWDRVWQELFENADSHFVPRPLYSMPFDQTWEALPNLTIIGDAAHLMSPFAGEGVNMAMLDALELGKNLTVQNFLDIQTAIASYEKQMRERASNAAKDSLDSQTVMHSENAKSFLVEMFGGVHN